MKWGHKDATGGAPAALTTSKTLFTRVSIVADKSNSGNVTIGNSAGVGIEMAPGAGVVFIEDDLHTILISGASGDGVGWGYQD